MNANFNGQLLSSPLFMFCFAFVVLSTLIIFYLYKSIKSGKIYMAPGRNVTNFGPFDRKTDPLKFNLAKACWILYLAMCVFFIFYAISIDKDNRAYNLELQKYMKGPQLIK